MLACFSGGWILQGRLAGHSDPYQQARLFEDVLVHIVPVSVIELDE